ncbi:hypothetical protein N657DRAFT_572244 [Parathielavia appendiculata]|uniref:Uncharacterized protein n=1 Tax=Parathielavia appendiculata TaxID=2587402 RepID=A0AAN6U1I2_9PEZI|nr:hypothetical protein N657DRAFT_572244 [Parathielavia appendiculata]
MASKQSDQSITSESAPLIKSVDCESDQDLFMVPLKRPSPKPNPESCPQPCSQLDSNPHQSPEMSGDTVKPDSPPMFTSPLMSPESGALAADGSPNMLGSAAQRSMGTPESLGYNSPPMSGSNQKAGMSPIMSPETGSAGQSPQPQSSTGEDTTAASRSTGEKPSPSTKASSVYDSPPAIVTVQEKVQPGISPDTTECHPPPEIPPLSAARALLKATPNTTTTKPANLGLALHLHPSPTQNTNTFLAPPPPTNPGIPYYPPTSPLYAPLNRDKDWTVPDSPLERLSQLRATPDSAYDRARQMEVRRSKWKHVVYRFPVRGADNWVVDADLTESSHARLAEVARRSSEGFEWNGDVELAGVYQVLSAAHRRVMEEMRGERRRGGVTGISVSGMRGVGEGRGLGTERLD